MGMNILLIAISKVASQYVQVALQPHKLRKLNLVTSEKSNDFSFVIKNKRKRVRKMSLNDKFRNYYSLRK